MLPHIYIQYKQTYNHINHNYNEIEYIFLSSPSSCLIEENKQAYNLNTVTAAIKSIMSYHHDYHLIHHVNKRKYIHRYRKTNTYYNY